MFSSINQIPALHKRAKVAWMVVPWINERRGKGNSRRFFLPCERAEIVDGIGAG